MTYGRVYHISDENQPPVAPEACRKCKKTCVHYGDVRYARVCQAALDIDDQYQTQMAALRS